MTVSVFCDMIAQCLVDIYCCCCLHPEGRKISHSFKKWYRYRTRKGWVRISETRLVIESEAFEGTVLQGLKQYIMIVSDLWVV
jgi:hypothetical protein